jgi:hypothetical protein
MGKMQTSEGIGAKYFPMHASHFAAQHELDVQLHVLIDPFEQPGGLTRL